MLKKTILGSIEFLSEEILPNDQGKIRLPSKVWEAKWQYSEGLSMQYVSHISQESSIYTSSCLIILYPQLVLCSDFFKLSDLYGTGLSGDSYSYCSCFNL